MEPLPAVEVVGVYPVEAPEPCHLIEVIVRGSTGRFDIGAFTQRDANLPEDEWQVPYDERLLDPLGESVAWDPWDGPGDGTVWEGDVRLAFFLHYVDLDSPLVTPFGDVPPPAPRERPVRLAAMVYEEPG
jgi:hypothetical protein